MRRSRWSLPLAGLAACTFAGSAEAAQIVTLDVAPAAGVEAGVAAALTSVMLNALSRREGMSVISQADVRALLELEANKQMLGCSDTACMTEIAGSLGAELLIAPSVARIGRTYVASLVLIDVDSAKVVRRGQGRAKGSMDMATEAMATAVHNLFQGGLPSNLVGPASLSRRGFQAALAGLYSAVLDPAADPRPSRKRIILDLVHTELDYDAKPKMAALDLSIRRSIAKLKRQTLVAVDPAQLDHLLRGVDRYRAMADDLGRVKEIRERARERGVAPSSRPLRFEPADIGVRSDAANLARYREACEPARQVVRRALAAYDKDDASAFAALWRAGYEGNAKRELESGRSSDRRNAYSYDLLPLTAMPPWLLERALGAVERGKMIVYLRRYKRGQIQGESQVRLERHADEWRISSW